MNVLDTLRTENAVRLDAEEAAALAEALAGAPGEAWLFGSRLDPARREEKIGVVVMNPARLTAEQAEFPGRIRNARVA